MNKDQLEELIGKLDRANLKLTQQAFASYAHPREIVRLSGKAEGVRLALSYIEEITRENHNAPE